MKRVKREEQQKDERFLYQGVPVIKILNYVKKDDLIDIFGWDTFKRIVGHLQAGDPTKKVLLRDIKNLIATSPDLSKQIKEFAGIGGYYQKYIENSNKLREKRNPEKNNKVRELMRLPKKQYVGCLATKSNPEDFSTCFQQYDDPTKKYARNSIIPYQKLRQDVADKLQRQGRVTEAALVQPGAKAHITDLPRGLRQYYKEHKEQYRQFMEESEELSRFLRSMERIIKNEKDAVKRKQLWENIMEYARNPTEPIELDL
jgi:hypothetical protein